MRESRPARSCHVRCARIVARDLEGVIDLDRAAEVEVPTVVERPATVRCLMGAQVDSDFCFEPLINLIHEVHHEDILSWNGAVRLELVAPIARLILLRHQGFPSASDGGGQALELGFNPMVCSRNDRVCRVRAPVRLAHHVG